jgi:hypothetical protein
MMPDYQGGSLANLMTSLALSLGAEPGPCPPLRQLSPEPWPGKTALIVADGLGQQFLSRHLPDSALMAHARGTMTSVFPSTTATAITTFMTGQAPRQHAITGWHMFFAELGALATVLPYRLRHGGLPLGDAGHLFRHLAPAPFYDRLPVASVLLSPASIAHSAFNQAHAGQAVIIPYASLEQMFELLARELDQAGRTRFVYAYYPEIDALAHEHGSASAQVRTCAAAFDEAFAGLLKRARGTRVIVTADHGFIDTAPEHCLDLADHPAFRACLTLPLCGEPRTAYAYVHAHKAKAFEDYARNHLSHCLDLRRSRDLVELGWFGPGPTHPRLLDRVGDYVLMMKENWIVRDWMPQEKPYWLAGVHGGVSAEEMTVPLIVAET